MKTNENDKTNYYFKWGYILFICLGLYHLLYYQDFIECAINMAIALIFDPFNQKIPWKERPKWQRVWLIVHLAMSAAFLGYGISV